MKLLTMMSMLCSGDKFRLINLDTHKTSLTLDIGKMYDHIFFHALEDAEVQFISHEPEYISLFYTCP